MPHILSSCLTSSPQLLFTSYTLYLTYSSHSSTSHTSLGIRLIYLMPSDVLYNSSTLYSSLNAPNHPSPSTLAPHISFKISLIHPFAPHHHSFNYPSLYVSSTLIPSTYQPFTPQLPSPTSAPHTLSTSSPINPSLQLLLSTPSHLINHLHRLPFPPHPPLYHPPSLR